MKKIIRICSFAALLLVFMLSVKAQSKEIYKVKIPFDFQIANESYQAGTYQVSVWNNRLIFRNKKTNDSKILLTSMSDGRTSEAPQFRFVRSGERNVLVEISSNDFLVKFENSDKAQDLVSLHIEPPADR